MPSTRRALLDWLELYKTTATRHAVEHHCANNDSAKGATTTATAESVVENNSNIIAGIEFPLIAPRTTAAPYIALPAQLTSAQRKVLHQLCQEVDLFHVTVHDTLYITIYGDGCPWIPGWLTAPLRRNNKRSLLHLYRPWVCRHSSSDDDDDNNNRTPQKSNARSRNQRLQDTANERILQLIDQPGDCFREDGTDTLDYERLFRATIPSLAPQEQQPSFVYVDTPALLQQAASELSHSNAIAIDLESSGTSVHNQITCLIQLASDTGREYVVDVLADPSVWDAVHDCLAPLCNDAAMVKIGHSLAGLDIPSLHRDFGITIVNAFDTHAAAQVLELPQQGLAAVCEYYGLGGDGNDNDDDATNSSSYSALKEQYQQSNWRQRPLSADQIEYARCDVRYLHRLRWLLLRDLVEGEASWEYDATHAEAERQAADEWRQMWLQWELEEDGMDDDAKSGGGDVPRPPPPTDALHVWRPNGMEGEEDDDDDTKTYQTSRTSGDDDALLFLTPANSTDNFDAQNITVAQLRLQSRVMRTIWLSQEACRDFWTPKPEPPPDRLVSLQKRNQEGAWNPVQSRCYETLVRWREQLAEEQECMPAILLPLDFLVLVAWKQPTTELQLRRIRYELPEVLEMSDDYRQQMLGIVLRSAMEGGSVEVKNDILLYADTTFGKKRLKWRRWRTMSWGDYESFAFSMAVGVVLCGALALVAIDGTRSARARR